MARKSNLVPTTGKDLLEKKFLLRQDISDKGNHLLLNSGGLKLYKRVKEF